MKVTINGIDKEFNSGITIANMLYELNIDLSKVAVERNLEIIPKSTFNAVLVNENDNFELVEFIGGG